MVTAAQFRALCLSLPGAEEKAHFGKADFRIANKIFAGFSEDPRRGYFKARAELQEELLAGMAGPFLAAQGAWGQHGWTYVLLPKAKLPMLRELIGESWRLVAPARLVGQAPSASTPKARAPRVRARKATPGRRSGRE
jgi:predicted DNA-binding protein (MmcQ/YjbR family)